MDRNYILGIYKDEGHLIDVTLRLGAMKVPIKDIFTPFPVHGLDEAMGIKRSRLPYVTFAAATLGLLLSLYFQYWTSAVDWPINVGGKPFNSFPAFIPVSFEITVLLGALATVGAFLFKAKLYPGKNISPLYLGASSDSFVVAIEKKDWSLDVDKIKEFFLAHGASEVLVKSFSEETGECCSSCTDGGEKK